MTPWEEVADLIAQSRAAFADLEKIARAHFDALTKVRGIAGEIVERGARMHREVERLAGERDAVSTVLVARKAEADREATTYYDAQMQEASSRLGGEIAKQQGVLQKLLAEVDDAQHRVQIATASAVSAEDHEKKILDSIDGELAKAKTRLATSQKASDQAIKEYEQKLVKLDSMYDSRETERRVRLNKLESDGKAAEAHLDVVKKAAREALAELVKEN